MTVSVCSSSCQSFPPVASFTLPLSPFLRAGGGVQALERQKEYTDAIRLERDELREEVVALKDKLKVLSPPRVRGRLIGR